MNVRFYHVLAGGPVVLTWIWAWRYLALEWSANEQYRFGFIVPLLGLYLGFQRWPDRLPRGQRTGFIFTFAALPILLLAELLRLTDPLWRLTGGVWMIGGTLLTIGYLIQLGGWNLLKKMVFPLGFLWVGLPWPMPLENLVVQVLSFKIATVTATLFNLVGIAALQRGNTIEIAGQIVGVDAACSGIQSLQAGLMASLFLWGCFRLPVLRGLLLQAAGVLISIALNLGRVIALTWCAHRFGPQNQALHDWIGGTATLLIFGGILLIAIRLRRIFPSTAANLENANGLQPLQSEALSRQSAPRRESQSSRFQFRLPARRVAAESSFSLALQAVLLTAFLMIPFSARAIVGSGNDKETALPRWRVDLDDLPAGWSIRALSATSLQTAMLRYTDWAGFRVRMPDGLWADIIHLFWRSGRGMPSVAFYHTPALCMPATGWQMIGEPEPIELRVRGGTVGFVRYVMQREDERVMALQFLSRGMRSDPFLVASVAGKGRLARLAELWRGAREAVNEEIPLYLPAPALGESDTAFAAEVFSTLFKAADL